MSLASYFKFIIIQGTLLFPLFSYLGSSILISRYSVIGWSLPWIPVAIALVSDSISPHSELAPQYGLPQCWLNSSYGLYIYFLIPLASMFVANVIGYVIVIVRFSVLAYQARRVRNSHHEKIILGIKLFFAFGLLWVFGLLSALFPGNAAIACIFIFSNSLTGSLMAVVFLCNKSVYKAMTKLRRERSSRSSKPTNLTPQHSKNSSSPASH